MKKHIMNTKQEETQPKQKHNKHIEKAGKKWIQELEQDLQGRQTFAYKAIKNLNRNEKERARINNLEEAEWLKYYDKLWCNKNQQNEEEDVETQHIYGIDNITLEELNRALKISKNRKAPGPVEINMELIKYEGLLLKQRYLHFINQCWHSKDIPHKWQKSMVQPIFKKGDRRKCENYSDRRTKWIQKWTLLHRRSIYTTADNREKKRI